MDAPVVKVKGIPKELGGRVLVIPPLSLGAIEQLQERLSSFTGDIADKTQAPIVIDAAHAALRRNYPELTREEVGELIDLENMVEIFEAVMDVAGLKRKALEAQQGGGSPGE